MFGVVGIDLSEKPLDAFENSVLLSILGEGALAIENRRNALEKEQAALQARNEELRANLLRTISHDLRTPLTSISAMPAICFPTEKRWIQRPGTRSAPIFLTMHNG